MPQLYGAFFCDQWAAKGTFLVHLVAPGQAEKTAAKGLAALPEENSQKIMNIDMQDEQDNSGNRKSWNPNVV